MNRKLSGLALVKSAVVIVVLGVLAAIAWPKFIAVKSSERLAVLRNARVAVASAMNAAHTAQTSQGLAPDVGVTLEGIPITMVNGYPSANAPLQSNIFAAAGLSSDLIAVNPSATSVTIAVADAPAPDRCAFPYIAATMTTPPVIGPDISSGC